MMDYKISVSDNRKYVVVKALKPMTTELSMAMRPEMMRVAEENDIKNILLDVRGCPNIQSAVKNYDFGYKDVSTSTVVWASRYAFLIDENDRSHDFITTVFLNAGFTVKQFTDEKAAIEWLENDPDAG